MARWWILLSLAVLTAGCSGHGLSLHRPGPGAQELFVKGLGQVAAGEKPSALTLLRQKYPRNPWADRAQTIVDLNRKVDEQSRAVDTLRREKDRCRNENARLLQQEKRFREDLEKLKKLLIENELRSH